MPSSPYYTTARVFSCCQYQRIPLLAAYFLPTCFAFRSFCCCYEHEIFCRITPPDTPKISKHGVPSLLWGGSFFDRCFIFRQQWGGFLLYRCFIFKNISKSRRRNRGPKVGHITRGQNCPQNIVSWQRVFLPVETADGKEAHTHARHVHGSMYIAEQVTFLLQSTHPPHFFPSV